ncbi:MAG: histidinol-phosphate transaminase [Alistipes sp.]|nr:histidinol-phosphate transaminase [Alistipes sp.]
MERNDIDRLVRRNIATLSPYSTARDEYQGELGTFLDANENPYENGYNRYPDPHQRRLKTRLSAIKGVPVENIFVGNGSDEAIDLIFRIFCEPHQDNVVAIAPSYGMYKVAAAINDIEVREVQLGDDFSLPVDAILGRTDANTKAIFLCSPNNPTGNAFPRGEILRLADAFDGITVVDEAYIDFAEVEGLKDEIFRRPRLIVLQTLSKAWAMAGLRIGLALADSRVVELMSMVKYPYNVSEATMRIVKDLLDLPVDDQVASIKTQRAVVMDALSRMKVVRRVYPSDANFVLVRFDDADAVYDHLIGDGIIVRNRNRVKGCEGCLRITIGLKEENDKLLKSLAEYETKSYLR